MARAMKRRKSVMAYAYVIASTCIDVKDGAGQEAWPECIYDARQVTSKRTRGKSKGGIR
jgi:hypothetical protein